MTAKARAIFLIALLLAGCDAPQAPARGAATDEAALPPIQKITPPPAPAMGTAPRLVAARLVLSQWSAAANRGQCAPLGFSDVGGQAGTARPATFAGGWAVAFDLPGKRSAYGLAGTGLSPDDAASEGDKRQSLIDQWPAFRDLPGLPQPAYAGYGREGAQPYADDDPQGLRANSLAYLRVGGQRCLYNVWSRLGRAHLERLLDGLRVIGVIAETQR